MTPDRLIGQLQSVPYIAGRGDMSGADCWGVVELWYRYILGIKLDDRSAHPPGHEGLQSGFDVADEWLEIEKPENNCLVIMRAGHLDAGHVGVFYEGNVLHSAKTHDCILQPITHRFIKSKITRFLKHK